MTEVQAALTAAPPDRLLPQLRGDEAARMVSPLSLIHDRVLGGSGSLRHVVVEDARGVRYGVPAMMRNGELRRARPGEGAASCLVEQLIPGAVAQSERSVPVDQTNELVAVTGEPGGRDLIVKWYLHPTPGNDRAIRRLDLLTAAGFADTPAERGRLTAPDGSLLALVTDYLPGAVDGWEWAVGDLRSHVRAPVDDGMTVVRRMGGLVGRMHCALSCGGVKDAAGPQVAAWSERAQADLAAALRERPPLDLATVDRARRMLADVAGMAPTPVMPIHGDLHVGQILRTTEGTLVVIDFDGNPILQGEDEDEDAPARDVAGMMASLDHVGRVVLHRSADLDPAERRRAREWTTKAPDVFLEAYVQVLAQEGRSSLLDERLLLPFRVQQECREYAYAVRYLPHWRYVPDAALPPLLAQGVELSGTSTRTDEGSGDGR